MSNSTEVIVAPLVAEALMARRPVVALETTNRALLINNAGLAGRLAAALRHE
jgi:pseudouridine-5'-phosphate glycosidase